MRPHGSPASLAKRRQRAVALLQQGLAPVDVARRVGVDRRSIRRWRATFEQQGESGLEPKPSPGRPRKLSDQQRAQLERWLLKGAAACGFATDLWTCPRVADLIQRRWGVVYHANHIGRLLRSLGWSPQRPARRARERDEETIQGWLKTDWPLVKKTPSA